MNEQDDFYSHERAREQHGQMESLQAYTAKTFGWMFGGLLITFLTAWFLAFKNIPLHLMRAYPYLPFVLLIVELLVVMVLSAKVRTLSVGAARGLFLFYAVLNGIVFSTYLILYDVRFLILVFGMTALYFGALALYGYFTKTDLARIRPILIGGLLLLLVFGVLSFFLNLGGFETVMCMVGIAVFLGFTAYDTQKIKAYHAAFAGDPAMSKKASIISALELYLDFINLFLYLLRLLGRKRN